ncbi:MAG: hypothetical protein ACTTHG_07480 [Treponemataceae bacterium]
MSSASTRRSVKSDNTARILEIRNKIHDEKYLDGAIYRIAMILSRKLMEDNEIERK